VINKNEIIKKNVIKNKVIKKDGGFIENVVYSSGDTKNTFMFMNYEKDVFKKDLLLFKTYGIDLGSDITDFMNDHQKLIHILNEKDINHLIPLFQGLNNNRFLTVLAQDVFMFQGDKRENFNNNVALLINATAEQYRNNINVGIEKIESFRQNLPSDHPIEDDSYLDVKRETDYQPIDFYIFMSYHDLAHKIEISNDLSSEEKAELSAKLDNKLNLLTNGQAEKYKTIKMQENNQEPLSALYQ
jgi:hypothetical protein